MNCARCSEKNLKRAYNVPSRKRGEFLEQVCKKCETLDKYERARNESAKRSFAIPCK